MAFKQPALAWTRPIMEWRDQLVGSWRGLAPRERRGAQAAGAAVALLLLWQLAVQPAWRAVRDVPAQLDQLDVQLQQMQRLAAEARDLRGMPTLSTAQSIAALKAASERLGDRAKLTVLGDRATLTLSGIDGPKLNTWLFEVRSGARVRPIDAELSRGPQGYQGTLVVSLGSAAP